MEENKNKEQAQGVCTKIIVNATGTFVPPPDIKSKEGDGTK